MPAEESPIPVLTGHDVISLRLCDTASQNDAHIEWEVLQGNVRQTRHLRVVSARQKTTYADLCKLSLLQRVIRDRSESCLLMCRLLRNLRNLLL